VYGRLGRPGSSYNADQHALQQNARGSIRTHFGPYTPTALRNLSSSVPSQGPFLITSPILLHLFLQSLLVLPVCWSFQAVLLRSGSNLWGLQGSLTPVSVRTLRPWVSGRPHCDSASWFKIWFSSSVHRRRMRDADSITLSFTKVGHSVVTCASNYTGQRGRVRRIEACYSGYPRSCRGALAVLSAYRTIHPS